MVDKTHRSWHFLHYEYFYRLVYFANVLFLTWDFQDRTSTWWCIFFLHCNTTFTSAKISECLPHHWLLDKSLTLKSKWPAYYSHWTWKSFVLYATATYLSSFRKPKLLTPTHMISSAIVIIWNTSLWVIFHCDLMFKLETHWIHMKNSRATCEVILQVKQLKSTSVKMLLYLLASCRRWGTFGSGSTGSASSGFCQSGSSGSLYMCSACCSGRCAWRSPTERTN